MERRDFLTRIGSAALGGLFLSSAPGVAFGQQDRQVLDALSAYMNNVTTMTGIFQQQNHDGRTGGGTFYIKRPGRLRFEYERPSPTLIIADRTWAMVINTRANTLDRVPLRSTPLYLLLKENVNLAAEGAVQGVEYGPGLVRVVATDPEKPHEGSVTMIFDANPIELRQWVVKDSQGRETHILIDEIKKGIDLNNRLFYYDEHARDRDWD